MNEKKTKDDNFNVDNFFKKKEKKNYESNDKHFNNDFAIYPSTKIENVELKSNSQNEIEETENNKGCCICSLF